MKIEAVGNGDPGLEWLQRRQGGEHPRCSRAAVFAHARNDGGGRMDSIVDFRAIVRAMGDAVIGAGRDDAIRLWNPAAERMCGFTPDEALGRSLDLIIPERFRN